MVSWCETADEDWARFNLERLKDLHPDFPWASLEKGPNFSFLIRVLGFSPYATNILARRREVLDLFLQTPFPRPRGRLALRRKLFQRLAKIGDWREAALYLRQIKQREIIKILAYDLAGEDFPRTVFALTALAEAFLEAGLFWLEKKFPGLSPSFLVLGMGKLGGRELNYSSDIDLIYFYHGPLAKREIYIRLAQELTKLVDTLLEGERLFRVDLRLRPGGKDGELVYSLKGGIDYYFTQSHPFERLALVKARGCAGNRRLGKKFLCALRPVIYPRYLDYTYLEHILDLKNRIAKEATRLGAERDIKIGPGGIREIEFFVQALQMIYGGKFPTLRTRNTLWAISRLEKTGLLKSSDQKVLKEAYVFLRTLEHRLQTVHFRQTAKLPEEETALRRLARAMGFFGEEAVSNFMTTLEGHRQRVREIFEELLSPKKKIPKERIEAAVSSLIRGEPSLEIARETGLPFDLLKNLQTFLHGQRHLSKKQKLIAALLPEILEEVLKIENKQETLAKFLSFLQRLGGRLSFFHALKHHPEAVSNLLLLFSKSAFLTNLLTEAPAAAEALFEPEPLEKEIKRAIHGSRYEEALSLLRTYKNESLFRFGLYDLKKELKLEELLEGLSSLALFVLQETYRVVCLRLHEELGYPFPGRFVVLGLGKLGSKELGYRSDLDMVFVYQSKDRRAVVYAAKLAQRLLSYLTMPLPEGPGYQVDTRLRPEGRKGPLAVSEEGFLHYYAHEAGLWEKLALVRLNYVAGDQELGGKVLREIKKLLAQGPFGPKEAQAVRKMRLLMERERTQAGKINLKVGCGGLADIEFILQWLILKNLCKNPEIFIGNVLEATKRLAQAEILSPEEADFLQESYLFLRTLDQKLILLLDKPGEEKHYTPEELEKTAPYLGPNVFKRYQRFTQENRRLFDSLI